MLGSTRMKSRHLLFIFLPALLVGGLGLLVQVIRYEPLYPKERTDAEIPVEALTVPIYDDDPILGDIRAPITLIAFEDLICATCREHMELLETLQAAYPKKFKIIWKGLPVTRFPESSELAHHYAFCAKEQKQFLAFLSRVIEEQNRLSEAALQSIAEQSGLNEEELAECLRSERPEEYQKKIEALAASLNIQAVPAIFMNNTQIQPPRDREEWITLLNLSR